MRIPTSVAFSMVLIGCTISPSIINVIDSEKKPVECSKPIKKIEFPEKIPLPPIPTFTERELMDSELIERKLVTHIGELRTLIQDYYDKVDQTNINCNGKS